MTVTIDTAELAELCAQAARAAGADPRAADALAEATVAAERAGNRAVGVAHLFDYLRGYREGRILPGAVPEVVRSAPACLTVDARNGLAQVAFGDALPPLIDAVAETGVAAVWLRNCYTCGELGHYPRQLAHRGYFALACANSPALMAIGGSATAVLGTNPLAYALPRPGRSPFVIDQATSATAYVNVREAARAGTPIPAGWAVGPDGLATTDAAQALDGALLPFGAHRGGNVALLVELLSTFAGASFSVDAPPFDRGQSPPGIGVFVLCVDLDVIAHGAARASGYLDRLRAEYGVSLPAMSDGGPVEPVRLDAALHQRLLDAIPCPDRGVQE